MTPTTRHILHILMAIVAMISCHATPCHADAIGTWRLYPSYNNITKIEPAGDRIYVIASGALYSYNTTDNSITTYDHITTLNSKDVTDITWASQTRRLIIAYADYTIDMLDENGTTTFITDIKDKELAGDKTIYSIYVDGRMAYLATGFGIVKIDTREGYIADSYVLNCKIDRCYTDTKYIYAMSEARGLLRASLADNLLNPNVWTRVGDYEPAERSEYVADTRHNCHWGPDPEGRLAAYTLADDGTYTQTSAGVCPDGPPTNSVWRLYQHNNRIYATAGTYAFDKYGDNDGMVYYYDGMTWHTLPSPSSSQLGYRFIDANCMAFDSRESNHFFVGAKSGLLEYRNDAFINSYNIDNSKLTGIAGTYNPENCLITSMGYDTSHNLWISQGWSEVPIKCFDSKGQWHAYSHTENTLTKLHGVDIQGTFFSPTNKNLWSVNLHFHTSCLFKYDTVNDSLVTMTEFYNQDGTQVPCVGIYDIAEDLRGNIWLMTSSGPLYIKQGDINEMKVTQHKVPRNDGTNYADYLLSDIDTQCIEIDGYNRKWIGTKGSGLYCISDDNNKELHHFTTDNSHLISNNIYDVIVEKNTGCLWIATDKGICSYQSDATQTGDTMDDDNITVYPNPVTPDFTGDVTIVGMTAGAQITITTASGATVHQGISTGGSYTWNTCDQRGHRVASGVYMVFMTYADGSKGSTAKIAIVR